MRTSKPSPSGHIRPDWDRPLHLKGLVRRKGEEDACSAGSQSGKPLYLLWGRLNKGQSEPQEVSGVGTSTPSFHVAQLKAAKENTVHGKCFLEGSAMAFRTAKHQETEKWRNKLPHLQRMPP